MTSFKNIVLASFFSYFLYSLYTFYELFKVQTCTGYEIGFEDRKCLKSLSSKTKDYEIFIYIMQKKLFDKNRANLIYHQILQLNETSTKFFTFDNMSYPIQNSTSDIYVYAFMLPLKEDPGLSDNIYKITHKINKVMEPKTTSFNLVKNSSVTTDESHPNTNLVDHVLTNIIIHVVDERRPLKMDRIPGEIRNLIRVNSKREYLPILYVTDIDSMKKRYEPLPDMYDNRSSVVPQIQVQPISFGKLRLFLTLEKSIESMKGLGFTDKDTDEIKSLFVDTNLYLLLLTFVISFFHMMFDVLAFKNDITFWKNRDSMAGISSKTVLWRCFSQIVVFLYLLDERTSLIVLVPTGVGVLIEMWKVTKAFKYKITLGGPGLLRFEKMDRAKDEMATQAYDDEAMKYLSYLMYPLCLGGAIYSLLYLPHKSWYSWIINSLVNGVYAFGFIFMLPQLIINYKMKSVAHLPWRTFMYKAFNTFIDDVFAFIITMPTTHRIACFRDDLIFVCYLYQRWLYPVDKARVNEFGQSFDPKKSDRKSKGSPAGDHAKVE